MCCAVRGARQGTNATLNPRAGRETGKPCNPGEPSDFCSLPPSLAPLCPSPARCQSEWPSPPCHPFPCIQPLAPAFRTAVSGAPTGIPAPPTSPLSKKITGFFTLLYCSWGEDKALGLRKSLSYSYKLGDWVRRHRDNGHRPSSLSADEVGQGQPPGWGTGCKGSQSLEKVTLFSSLFSVTAWTDLVMSWVCSMLMFQDAWYRGC